MLIQSQHITLVNIASDAKARLKWGLFVCMFLCVNTHVHSLCWSSSEGRVWAVLIQHQGKGPVMVAMVNMAPCRVLAVPSSPSSPLLFHCSLLFLSTLPLLPPFAISSFFFLISLSLHLLHLLPSPIFPSCHSDPPISSKQDPQWCREQGEPKCIMAGWLGTPTISPLAPSRYANDPKSQCSHR